jgi:hypothetical protein
VSYLVLLISRVLLSALAPASAQSLPSAKEISQWIEKARAMSTLDPADISPYHLVATFRYSWQDKSLDGTYEVLWAAPDRVRIGFRMGSISETEILLADKKYVERNTPTMTVPMAILELLPFPPHAWPFELSKTSVEKPRLAESNGTRDVCAKSRNAGWSDLEFCFDATSSELTSQHVRSGTNGQSGQSLMSTDLTDYVTSGKIRYPRHLQKRMGMYSMDVTIEKWEPVQKFSDDVFVPLPDGRAWDWCLKPDVKLPKDQKPVFFPAPVGDKTHVLTPVAIYEIDGPDGIPERVTPLVELGDEASKEFFGTERHRQAAIRSCGGKPISYERIIWIEALVNR